MQSTFCPLAAAKAWASLLRTNDTESETLNSVPVVLVFEVEEFDTTGNTNDRLYIMFKFPYASNDIPDTNVKWAMMCDINDTANPPQTGWQHTLVYSSGDMDAATDLNGNANQEFKRVSVGRSEVVFKMLIMN